MEIIKPDSLPTIPIPNGIRNEIAVITSGPLTVPEFRDKIVALESAMERIAGAVKGDDAAPLEHSFGDGLYRRTIHMPRGMWITSKIHKMKHFFYITQGSCMVWDEKGGKLLKAPYEGVTLAGTKRLLYILEDCTWTTVHKTDSIDLAEIEREIIAESFSDLPIIEGEFEEVLICHG
jgi:hypothetical protein